MNSPKVGPYKSFKCFLKVFSAGTAQCLDGIFASKVQLPFLQVDDMAKEASHAGTS